MDDNSIDVEQRGHYAFADHGVRPTLLPLLINGQQNFRDRIKIGPSPIDLLIYLPFLIDSRP
jgi:hypothetical protein